LSIQYAKLNKKISKIHLLNVQLDEIYELLNISKSDNDINLFNELLINFNAIKKDIISLEIESLFKSKYDSMNTFLDIQAGSGGLDAQDWVGMLFKMYTNWFEKKDFSSRILNISYGEHNGIKSISLKIIGDYAFGWLKNESGIHRLIRKSDFDSNKRHTSFASVFVYPDNQTLNRVLINDNDLKIETFRSSGAGGQHVNTTDSAVRIKHIPTGLTVKCQSERSQHKNKNYAMKQLKSKLHALNLLKNKSDNQTFEKNKLSITWGNQIRSYVLDKSIIKDLRSNLEINDINLVLNGHLDPLIFSVLNMENNII